MASLPFLAFRGVHDVEDGEGFQQRDLGQHLVGHDEVAVDAAKAGTARIDVMLGAHIAALPCLVVGVGDGFFNDGAHVAAHELRGHGLEIAAAAKTAIEFGGGRHHL